MPQYDHLSLARLPESLDRRKVKRAPLPPIRDSGHSQVVRTGVAQAVAAQRAQRPAEFIDPSLILKVEMNGLSMEDDWDRLGLRLLSNDTQGTTVLFSSTDDLTEFRQRLDAYDAPIPFKQKNKNHAGFIDRIESVGTIMPRDRLGLRLLQHGFTEVSDFQDTETYVVDIELWDFASQIMRRNKAEQIALFIEARGGEVFDTYVGPSLTIIRIQAVGSAIRPILSVAEVASVDLPPEPDLEAQPIIKMALDELPAVNPVLADAPIVAILDSGINAHPLLVDVLIASEAFPAELGTADVFGHGTRVGGAAVFGDLRQQIASGQISKSVRLISAKILTDQGKFHERRTLPSQMREAFQRLTTTYGCRIFVLSLGDKDAWFEQGRVGPWAMTLDELARDLNVLIFVSAGNRAPRGGTSIEQSVTQYPEYLLEEANRLFEPAGAVNVVTVGSVAHGSGLGVKHAEDTHVQAITGPMEPSPFTRSGPGAAGITKPDFVDVGGTVLYDAVTRQLLEPPQVPEAGIVTLNHNFVQQLFTSAKGTSYSAPVLARKAAFLLQRFPTASANLVRALLAGASSVPEASNNKLSNIDPSEQARIVGNGIVDALKAAYSDDHRVVYYADDQLDIDKFAIYKVPIPAEFQSGGKRTIRVSLAFDPPVRRTRAEYVGTKMDFRLIRGCSAEEVSAHFKSYSGTGEKHPEMEGKYKCELKPGPNTRDKNTLQTAEVTYKMPTPQYGEFYYLVVRCAGGWAEGEVAQKFAVVVELEHQASIKLYARLRPRLRT
ncbi:S8 family peptidase [Pseudovibrio sp. Alg231-02]|uniref:S8 family peptidase n=1 Tax=Pseudovibrio sp. Alg231-02 TaxID=1922223 RepID=UPI001FCBB6D1|nr:S8 family peptidase [Pseudovibrio sp. Alg231-02]